MYEFKALPVVGQASSEMWSQVVELTLAEVLSEKTFPVYCAMTVGGEEATTTGRELVEAIQKIETVTLEKIKETVEQYSRVQSFVAVQFGAGEVLIGGYGQSRVVLARGKRLGQVFTAPLSGWRYVKGTVVEKDRWLLGTRGLVGEMSTDLTYEVLNFEEANLAGEELVTRVQAADESAGAAGWVVHVSLSEEQGLEDRVELEKKEVEEPRPQVFLRRQDKRRKRLMIMGIVVIVILGASLGWGWWQRGRQEIIKERAEVISGFEAKLNTARNKGTGGISEIREVVGEMEKLKSESKDDELVKVLTDRMTEAQKIMVSLSGEKALSEVPLWFNLGIVKEEFFGERLAMAEDDLIVLDRQHGLLAAINAETKEAELVGGGVLLQGAEEITATKNRALVYGSKGIIDVALSQKTTAELVSTETEWKKITAVGIFAGNVYLLDVGASEIWQYPGLTSGVGGRRRWFGTGTQPDLSGGVDMAIDGDVWVLLSSGTIQRYRRGMTEAFTPKGLVQPISQGSAIFTADNLTHVYVFDREQKAVVALTKEGNYVKQWLWQGLATASDIVVSDKAAAIFVVSGSSVYRIPLE